MAQTFVEQKSQGDQVIEGRLHRRKGGGLSFLMGGDGVPLLLLHGIPGSAQTWTKVGTKLGGRFRVIIPDLLGFGASEGGAGGFYLEEQGKAARGLLAHLHITDLYLGGHDFGGPVALTLMRLYPELNVRGLILAAANVFTDTPIPPALRVAKVPGVNRLFFWAMAGNRWGSRMLYDTATQNKEESTWRDFRRHLTPRAMLQTSAIFRRSLANLKTNYQTVEEMLPTVRCPALVLWGDEDPFFAAGVGERVCAALPHAVLKLYAYTGHFVPEERPVETAEDILLRFE